MDETCCCGHAADEHDEMGDCTVEGCMCFQYEACPDPVA